MYIFNCLDLKLILYSFDDEMTERTENINFNSPLFTFYFIF